MLLFVASRFYFQETLKLQNKQNWARLLAAIDYSLFKLFPLAMLYFRPQYWGQVVTSFLGRTIGMQYKSHTSREGAVTVKEINKYKLKLESESWETYI